MDALTPRATGAEQTAGDRDAWLARLVEEQGEAAYRTAYRLLRDRNDAHDAVQDALTTAFRRWHELRSHDTGTAWFFRILVNGCISRLRRQRVRYAALQLFGARPAQRAEDPSVTIDVSERVLPRLMKLPIKQRTALILRFGDDRSIDEIASAMNVGTESVKTHLKRGLAQLRGQLAGSRSGADRE
jgi:RNA polymerase sigma-70 factor, ECF subfamily